MAAGIHQGCQDSNPIPAVTKQIVEASQTRLKALPTPDLKVMFWEKSHAASSNPCMSFVHGAKTPPRLASPCTIRGMAITYFNISRHVCQPQPRPNKTGIIIVP